MKNLFILLIAAAFFTGCEQEIIQTPDSIKEEMTEVTDTRAAAWPPKFKIKIKLKIDSGTRKTAEKYEDLGIGNGTKCQGRSMCLQSVANPGGGDDIVDGDATFAEADFVPFETQYAFTLATSLEGGFLYGVHPNDILPEISEIVFEGGVFVMDADYEFTEEVTSELDVDFCVLPAGTYEVIEDEEGRKYFKF